MRTWDHDYFKVSETSGRNGGNEPEARVLTGRILVEYTLLKDGLRSTVQGKPSHSSGCLINFYLSNFTHKHWMFRSHGLWHTIQILCNIRGTLLSHIAVPVLYTLNKLSVDTAWMKQQYSCDLRINIAHLRLKAENQWSFLYS